MLDVVIADDHPVVRRGLRSLLETEEGIRVVAEAADGLEAIREAERCRPTVVLMDLMMPRMGGLEAIREIREKAPESAIVVLSISAEETYVLQAMRAGASAYVLKDAPPDDLIRAVRDAAAGRRFLSRPFLDHALDAWLQQSQETLDDALHHLSTREREVLQLCAEGLTVGEIAEKLVLSPRTVETHRGNVMRKLSLRNQTELVRFALRRGIIEP